METKLRSQQWFGKTGKDGFIYRAWMRNQGLPDDAFRGKPIIGICNTWSDLTPCNGHFRDLAESVKKGIIEMGGVPVEFPVMFLGEKRRRAVTAPVNPFERGYTRLFVARVEQAHLGVDFDFLKGSSGSKVTRDSH